MRRPFIVAALSRRQDTSRRREGDAAGWAGGHFYRAIEGIPSARRASGVAPASSHHTSSDLDPGNAQTSDRRHREDAVYADVRRGDERWDEPVVVGHAR